MTNKITFRDVEKLSAYLDRQLSRKDAARLEARLAQEADLQAILEDLRRTRAVLRAVPKRRAPRNFVLAPEKQRVRPPVPRTVPVLRFASVVATLLLIFAMATNFVVPLAAQRAAAPPMNLGYGGGGGDQAMEAVVEESAPLEPEMAMPAAEPATTEEAAQGEPSAADIIPTQVVEAPPLASKQAGEGEQPPEARFEPTPFVPHPEPQPEPEPRMPVSSAWQIGLLVAALVLAFLAFGLRWLNDKRWGKRN